MMRLRHPYLLSLVGVCTRGGEQRMVLEYMSGGSLEDWLAKRGARALEDELFLIVHQAPCRVVWAVAGVCWHEGRRGEWALAALLATRARPSITLIRRVRAGCARDGCAGAAPHRAP